MMRRLVVAVLVFVLGSVAALAADLNGKWTADIQGHMGTQTINFVFHVNGSKLTGTVMTMRGQNDISNGKVEGDNLSFDQVMNFNGTSFTIHYAGKAEGNIIRFTRQMAEHPATNFIAKRPGNTPGAK